MTIEEFEATIENTNGKGEWFAVTYYSEYKMKSIKVETIKNEYIVCAEKFKDAFKYAIDIIRLKENR